MISFPFLDRGSLDSRVTDQFSVPRVRIERFGRLMSGFQSRARSNLFRSRDDQYSESYIQVTLRSGSGGRLCSGADWTETRYAVIYARDLSPCIIIKRVLAGTLPGRFGRRDETLTWFKTVVNVFLD